MFFETILALGAYLASFDCNIPLYIWENVVVFYDFFIQIVFCYESSYTLYLRDLAETNSLVLLFFVHFTAVYFLLLLVGVFFDWLIGDDYSESHKESKTNNKLSSSFSTFLKWFKLRK